MKTHFHFLGGLALLLGIAGCSRQKESATVEQVKSVAKEKAKEAKDDLQRIKSAKLKGASLGAGDSQGRPLWEIAAKEIHTEGDLTGGDAKQALLTDAKATLFRAGKPESVLTAAKVRLFYTKTGVRLQMTENVTMKSEGPWTKDKGAIHFTSPRADVDIDKHIVSASGGVKMNQGAVKVESQTLRAQTSLQTVDVAGNVKGMSEKGQMEAASATYNWHKGDLAARNVTAKHDGTQIKGDSLKANTETSRGIVTGHVVAVSAKGNATAPQVDFDWKKDRIVANTAAFNGQEGKLTAARLETDSKLRVASAQGFTAQKEGATIRAAFVDGFDNLSRIKGRDVTFQKDGMTLTAGRADASQRGNNWVLVASGGARGQSSKGNVSASRVTWDEGAKKVLASGGVTLQKDGSTLSGSTLDSDTEFNNATLAGNVRGKLKDGSALTSGILEKRGERLLASRGVTAKFPSKGSLGVLTVEAPRVEATADGASAVATGGVKIESSTGARAQAPRATYNRKANKVTATGGVDFYDPEREIRQHGDTLTADLTLHEARLTNPRGQVGPKLFEGKKGFGNGSLF